MTPLAIRALIVVAGAAAAFGAGWMVNGWRLGEQIAQMERDQVAAAAAENEVARLKERSWNTTLQEARNEAVKRETKLRTAAAAARNAADGLRGDLADLRHQLPDLAADACRERGDSLARVLDSCQQEYQSMAEDAERMMSDRQLLIDAWPK